MEQEDFKQKHDLVKKELSELYLRMFKQFHNLCTLELPGELSALSAAYGVDKEEVFLEAIQNHMNLLMIAQGGKNV